MALFRANFISTVGSLQVVNVLHVATHDLHEWTATPDPNPQSVADELDTQLTTLYRAMLPTEYTLLSIDVSTVGQPHNPAQVPAGYSKVKNLAGTRTTTNNDLPGACCAVVKLKTGLLGRSFRGHLFAPPCEATNQVVADKFSASGSYKVAVDAFAAKLTASFTSGAGWSSLWSDTWAAKIVVYSPTRHARNDTPFASNVKTALCDGSVHWLRSRLK